MKKYGIISFLVACSGVCLASEVEENLHKNPKPVIVPEKNQGRGGWWIPSDQPVRRNGIKPKPKINYVDPVKE